MVAAGRGQFREAVARIQTAVSLKTDQAEYHAQLARCLSLIKREREARTHAEKAFQLRPSDSQTLDTIGVVLTRVGDHEKAAQAFRRAAELAPHNASLQFNLAASLKYMGRFKEARNAYERAVRLQPDFLRAHWALSTFVTATPDDNRIQELERLLETLEPDVNGALYLCHALAKEYEDLGQHKKAFEYLQRGKLPKISSLRYSVADDRDIFVAIQRVCSAEFCRLNAPGHETEEPIFIVGMPRTGTTLVERILSSHDDVFAAGELNDFGLCLKRATRSLSNKYLDVETVELGSTVDFRALGKAYIDCTRPRIGHTRYFVDKMPINFLHAGFIHRALPNAKIICLRRNPLDTCLSNYRQLFSVDSSYYRYAYDLLDTGHYYLLFDTLVKHWQESLPENFLVIQYEAVVENLERESRRLFEFCDLPWNEGALKFHENTGPVATASAVQVRHPVNRDSVGRWKHYERQLEPLIHLLSSYGIECN